MATSLVSGRVSEECKERAGFYIRRAGLTASDVIRIVWENIAKTGEVPTPVEDEPAEENPLLERLASLRASTPRSDFLENLTAADMRKMVRNRDEL